LTVRYSRGRRLTFSIRGGGTVPLTAFGAVACDRDATMILVGYRHGLRVSELCALRWDQVDFERGMLHVRRAKNGTPSVHPLGGFEIRAFRRLRREQPESRHVFLTERLSPMSPVGFRTFRDRPELLFAASGVFARHEPDPAREVTTRSKNLRNPNLACFRTAGGITPRARAKSYSRVILGARSRRATLLTLVRPDVASIMLIGAMVPSKRHVPISALIFAAA
jgi:Phage integrase family